MAKIQLLIEIEERLYKNIIDNDKDDEEFEAMDVAFNNAKPLPKGHGDLKDADRLLDGFYEYCKNGDFGYHQAEDLIKSSLTIIEADKEG